MNEQTVLGAILILLLLFCVWQAFLRVRGNRKEAEQPAETRTAEEQRPGPVVPAPMSIPPAPTPQYSDFSYSMIFGAIHDDFIRLLDRFITIVLKENDVCPSLLMAQTGYHQATRFIDHMETIGIVGPLNPPFSREIRITEEQYHNILRKKLFQYRTELDGEDSEFVNKLLSYLSKDLEEIRAGTLTSESLHDDDLARIDQLKGPAFGQWCDQLLTRLGFRTEPDQAGGHGVDFLAEKEDVLYAFQCRADSEPLSSTPVQEVWAGQRYYNRHVGVVLTNSRFTQNAREQAKKMNVLLWDRDKLKLLIDQANLRSF